MALSPNYGWTEPDNTGLVKNGAQDMRTLGDAIDASVWNIGFGQAGKNKIINGDFGIWQRGTSFNAASNAFTADRWNTLTDKTGASVLTTQQAFTAGAAPVAGYESQFFLRTVFPSGGSFCIQEQRIEDVRTFAGQTVTLSFWAKANATATIAPTLVQSFGTGGSANVETTTSNLTLTTSWVRYSVTATLPSISGKTIGAGNYLTARAMRAVTASGFTIDIWGVQLEYGSKATPFETASGSIQGELAMCQRYYQRFSNLTAFERLAFGSAVSTSSVQITVPLRVTLRVAATSIDFAGITVYDGVTQSGFASSVVLDSASANFPELTISGGIGVTVTYRPYWVIAGNTINGSFLGFSAEL
jgi:hypothetical protein